MTELERMKSLAGLATEDDASARVVTTLDGRSIVGLFTEGVGFEPNKIGIKMGFLSNYWRIPKQTRITHITSSLT